MYPPHLQVGYSPTLLLRCPGPAQIRNRRVTRSVQSVPWGTTASS